MMIPPAPRGPRDDDSNRLQTKGGSARVWSRRPVLVGTAVIKEFAHYGCGCFKGAPMHADPALVIT